MASPHVALLALPFASQPNTLHALAVLLASAAPHAAFSFISSPRSCATLDKVPSPPNLSLHHMSDGCGQTLAIEPFLQASPGNFVDGMQRAVRERGGSPITSIICDVLVVPLIAGVAEEMGVPWVAFRTGGTSTLLSHVYTDEIRSRVGVGDDAVGDRKLDFIPSLAAFQVSDLPEGVVHGNLHSPFNQLLHSMGTRVSDALAVAVNTCAALESPVVADLSTKFSNFFPVGPLSLLLPQHQPSPEACDTTRCLSWLDEHPRSSVVYIACGTFFSLEEAELMAIAEALESTGFPFLWSLKEEARLRLPSGFLEKAGGLVVQWSPQAELLRHPAVGVFVTHCGWKSVLDSVAGEVPMICRPMYGDQRMNARQVVDVWRIGLWREGEALTGEWVAAALHRVLKEDDGRGMRERARVLGEKAREAAAAAAAAEGGSSLDSLKELAKLVTTCNPTPPGVA